MKRLVAACVTALALWAGSSQAIEKEGVQIPDKVTVGGTELELNGTALRQRMMMKAYVAALYVPKKSSSDKELIAQNVPMRMAMYVTFSLVPKGMVVSGWSNNVPVNTTPEELKGLEERLNKFYSFFTEMHQGDTVFIDYIPGKGTSVINNGKVVGTIEGDDFFDPLLKVWIGETPVDDDFKKGLIGG